MKNEYYVPLYIDGIQTRYKISNLGNIINNKTNKQIAQYLRDGYLKSTLKYKDSYRSFNVAILVIENFKNKYKTEHNYLLFKDNNRMNVDSDNVDIVDIDELYDSMMNSFFTIDSDGVLRINNGNIKDEVWKQLVVNTTITPYVISSYGRVFNIKTGLFLTPTIPKDDRYPFMILKINGKSIRFTMHRLVAELFVNNPNKKKFNIVNHLNENKKDYRASNLNWTDSSGNAKYSLYKNKRYGENAAFSKIKEKNVIKICEMLANGYKISEIVATTGFSRDIVRHIKCGDTWKHISVNYNFDNSVSKYIKQAEEMSVLNLRKLGKTYDEISKITGKTKRVIYRILKSNGLVKPNTDIFITEDVRSNTEISVIKLYNYNIPVKEISEVLGLKENKVLSILINNNIISYHKGSTTIESIV